MCLTAELHYFTASSGETVRIKGPNGKGRKQHKPLIKLPFTLFKHCLRYCLSVCSNQFVTEAIYYNIHNLFLPTNGVKKAILCAALLTVSRSHNLKGRKKEEGLVCIQEVKDLLQKSTVVREI